MRLAIDEARRLSTEVLRRHHLTEDDAEIVTDHLIDAHLTGYTFAGLPRLLVVLERLRANPNEGPARVEVVRETPVSAVLDGHHSLGYVVCRRAVDLAIAKATDSGFAVVGAAHSYYSGRSGYYTARAARRGLVALHASHAFPMVAPTGGRERVLGSNPLTLAFPAPEYPVVCDISTASITWGELQLADRLGERIPAGSAIDREGNPTEDPAAALTGAALPWGAAKGYALSVAVQALGILAGGDVRPEPYGNFGFFFAVWRPDLLTPAETFTQRMGELVTAIKSAARVPGADEIFLPGERSHRRRERALRPGVIELPDRVYADLLALTVPRSAGNRGDVSGSLDDEGPSSRNKGGS